MNLLFGDETISKGIYRVLKGEIHEEGQRF